MSQKADSVPESSLQKRQNEGKHSKNVVPAVVHKTAEETELFTGGLQFHQIIQPEGKTQILYLEFNNNNTLSKLAINVLHRRPDMVEHSLIDIVICPDHGFGGHE